ncbi:PGF-pre-PGF domain-containing protein [Candidatus Nanohalobium constans]|uniref:PGF-pre-PGF domain-containing protein n=1 Tax=Candidatus Nanohalobium constans TaxID=2565781 RepID=A0A5Q0UGV4_9ARCH|nr:PGF-pre-PGF domain-containing protein [Candidatus Nanohalobium constans]QGA80858.1 PGF-pre-PGF domain-containing protein [Candidatus Nanohalobium constans]
MKMNKSGFAKFGLVLTLLMISFGFSAAQTGAPGKPASFYGDAVDENGNGIPVSSSIVAVTDGEVIGSIEIADTGVYGSEAPMAEKLSVNSGAGDEVSFRVNSSDGVESVDSPYSLESGTQNIDLVFPDDTFAPQESEDGSGSDDDSSDSSDGSDDTDPGGTLPPSDDKPEPKQVDAEVDPETGQASAQVDQVEENQQVQVNIPDTEEAESTVEQVSFTSSSSSDSVSVSVSDLGTDRPETVSEDAGSDVYSYQQIDVEGVEDEDITESNVKFKVQKSYLDDRGRSPEDVVMKRYNDQNWQELDTRIGEELDNSYRFEASSTGFSYYAIALQEQENETQGEPNIQTSSLNVQPLEGTPPFDVTIDVTVENTGDAEGTQEVEVTLGDEVIKSETVSLEAGEERTLSYNYTVEQSGSLSFSAGNQSTTVEASQKGTPMLPVAVALLIVAILGVVGYTQRETIQDKVEDLRE